ncbi:MULTISPECIES: copper ion binding protein [Paenibacillus]|jgi:copper chaperone|uniref:Copper chaperone CopZ n=3 Tax=Paenibacillus TaxID=44249 RepID=G7W3V0_PAETH|nr:MULTISPECIES: copper ion binding protein [Paenibacillus]AET58710.1 copper chaperone CopZ [Paenibacillus terrae HPL-003]ASR49353.1 copper resistance protein CopZ [Paenibacillus kribbensis]EHS59518.1 copper chaperone CopZ [Paenibacillus sp. Aloe-11]MDQ0495921.1 copper chaperone [Paenibacillus brasilensis]MEC0237962.1 copper ion binding protein [Paenibacillus kribbensis]
MAQVTLNVEGMSCNHCVKAVEGALEKVGASGKVNLEAKQVAVEYDESKLNVEALKTAIEDQGYDVV